MRNILQRVREKLFCLQFRYLQYRHDKRLRKQMNDLWEQERLRSDLACCIYWSGADFSYEELCERLEKDYTLTISSLSSALELTPKRIERLYTKEPKKLHALFEETAKLDFDLHFGRV